MDCDYVEGISTIPNPWLMKVSSYYIQKGYKTALVSEVKDIASFERVVIVKEYPTNYLPSPALLISNKVDLIGSQFTKQLRYWDMPPQVFAARPNYSLYKFEFPTDYTNASFMCLTYKGRRIRTQNQLKAKEERTINYLIDRHLWQSDQLELVLDDLAKVPKLKFLENVDFSSLENEVLIEKFAKLRLFKDPINSKKIFHREELINVVNIVNKIKKIKSVSISPIDFITMQSELDSDEALQRYMECIKVAADANSKEVSLNFLVPRDGVFEFAAVMRPFDKYNNKKESFFSYLCRKEEGKTLRQLVAEPHFKESQFYKFIQAIKEKDPDAYNSGFIQWGGFPDNEKKIIGE